jgi:hypothetical protein
MVEYSYDLSKKIYLPILSKNNINIFPEWHNYYYKVYNNKVNCDVDLNDFEFFYYFAPFTNKDKITKFLLPNQRGWDEIEYNLPICFTSNKNYQHYACIIINKSAGFFVKRKLNIKYINKTNLDYIKNNNEKNLEDKYLPFYFVQFESTSHSTFLDFIDKKFLEVIRTNLGEGKLENKKVWFYVVKGSGFFIENKNPLTPIELRTNITNITGELSNEKINAEKKHNKHWSWMMEAILDITNLEINANDSDVPLFRGNHENMYICKNIYDNCSNTFKL